MSHTSAKVFIGPKQDHDDFLGHAFLARVGDLEPDIEIACFEPSISASALAELVVHQCVSGDRHVVIAKEARHGHLCALEHTLVAGHDHVRRTRREHDEQTMETARIHVFDKLPKQGDPMAFLMARIREDEPWMTMTGAHLVARKHAGDIAQDLLRESAYNDEHEIWPAVVVVAGRSGTEGPHDDFDGFISVYVDIYQSDEAKEEFGYLERPSPDHTPDPRL